MLRGLGRPRRLRGPAVAAHYARVLDGRTLWIALPEAPPTVTLRYDGGELVEPTEPETAADLASDGVGLVSARVPLEPLTEPAPGSELVVEVLAGDGRHAAAIAWTESAAPGPVRAAIPSPDRRWRWHLGAPEGHLRLLREPFTPPRVVLEGLLAHDDGRGARLLLGGGRQLDVRADEHTGLDPGESTALLSDGHAVARRFDDLRRPQQAVPLPSLGDGLRLRWSAEATLLVVRERG